jgi:hypothetical protein
MRKTIQLFQLLIIIFTGYCFFYFSEDIRLYIILGCAVITYILEKIDTLVLDKQKLQILLEERKKGFAAKKKSNSVLDRLTECKNGRQLTEAIGMILKKMGYSVNRPIQEDGVDLEFLAPGTKGVFGLKAIATLEGLEDGAMDFDALKAFAGVDDNHKVVIISGNTAVITGEGDGLFSQGDFSQKSEALLKQHQIVAMTTSTLQDIFMLCKLNGIDSKLFLMLFQEHAGGVFRLDDYARKLGSA